MADETGSAKDFTKGIAAHEVGDGVIVPGRVGDVEVLVARQGSEIFAISARCTHYHGPLAEGLLVGDTVRCPWHHACFSLRTGEPVRAPALDPVDRWRIEQQGDMLFVRQKLEAPPKSPSSRGRSLWPESVVIIGGGAAGLAAADVLRREGYDRPIAILSADDSPPCDRPNLSKDYLAGTAQEDWIPLRAPEFYTDNQIELSLSTRVTGLDVRAHQVQAEGGRTYAYGALLIATGADPVRLVVPGADRPHVRYLRTFADSKAIVSGISTAKQVVVIGASFIGLEVAASLRTRGVNVSVVAPESLPMERILGREVGRLIQTLHESKGVEFHLGRSVTSIEASRVLLDDGTSLNGQLVVVGIGVRPALALAQQGSLAIDRGIAVNEYLETSASGVFAAGDVARWPDPHSREPIRVEHWVVAERQGQTAARNILGYRERFDAVPFFWSQHYDIPINYVGHAESFDAVKIDGRPESHDCMVTYQRGGRRLAVATIFRDRQSLQAEVEMEQG
jgi:NADPH-dependent 2,4-dienoyl-CoA reductase/sulfur reductase-like enzyme/nitrite reductase/ring-hydroxylating ferredoxin subunit